MKYSIEGLKDERIIASVNKVDGEDKKYIMVNYLDGTQDVFDFNEKHIKKIMEIMNNQASKYVESKKNSILKARFSQVAFTTLGVVGIAGFSILAAMNASSGLVLIGGTIGVVASTLTVIAGNKEATKKVKDVKKYEVYVNELQTKLEDYNNIITKEKALSGTDNIRLNNILDLDSVSLEEAKHIADKIERYHEIDGKGPKVKSI